MIPSQILNHKEGALLRLLEQYKDAENIKGIIEIYSDQIQELENLLFPMFEERLNIQKAIGQQLDEIGEIVVQKRGSATDERYRLLLLVKIGINTSQGTPENVIQIFKLMTESDYVHLINLGLAEIELEGTTGFIDQDEVNFIFNSAHQLVAAGVRVNDIRCVHPTDAFGFAGSDNNPPYLGFTSGEFSTPYRYGLPFAFSDENGNDTDATTDGFGAGHADPLLGGQFIG